jgi:hypothetical protein
VCGHSLGGGYAQLAALELLQHVNSEIKPSAVVTFGSPLVIVPDPKHENRGTWEALDAICLAFINSFDPVPRMLGPCGKTWWDMLASMYSKHVNEQLFGSVGFYFDMTAYLPTEYIQTCEELVCDYNVVGKTIFVSSSAPAVYELHSSDTADRQRKFRLLPSDFTTRLNDLTLCHKTASNQKLLQSLLRQHAKDGNGAGAKPRRRSFFGWNKSSSSSTNEELEPKETATEVLISEESPQERGEFLRKISEAYNHDATPSDCEVLNLIVDDLQSRYTRVDGVGLDDILSELLNLEMNLQAEVTNSFLI